MTPEPTDLHATVRAQLQALDASGMAQTLVTRPRSTVVPPDEGNLAGARALETLLRLERAPLNLRDEGPLGAGGMGEVRLATQVALDRKVAVKSLPEGRRERRSVEALLGEAWLAGSLEHPNVLPDACIDRVDILFPDPWPKARHHKRRLVQTDFVASLARIVKPGGEVRFATDWANYAAWTLEIFTHAPDFAWLAESAADWRNAWPGHVTTRYEEKKLGDCAPIWLRFERA